MNIFDFENLSNALLGLVKNSMGWILVVALFAIGIATYVGRRRETVPRPKKNTPAGKTTEDHDLPDPSYPLVLTEFTLMLSFLWFLFIGTKWFAGVFGGEGAPSSVRFLEIGFSAVVVGSWLVLITFLVKSYQAKK
jgi:hypothetical protein